MRLESVSGVFSRFLLTVGKLFGVILLLGQSRGQSRLFDVLNVKCMGINVSL